MKSPSLGHSKRGVVLATVLILMGILSIVFAAYLSLVDHHVRLITRATARAQALYLAEAGLDAANDLLAQQWETYHDDTVFPMRERVAASRHGAEVPIGEFDVVASELSPRSLRLTSTGRSLPTSTAGAQGLTYQIERTLSMVIVRKERPAFQRRGYPGRLELDVSHFDADGIPDLLAFSGALDAAQGPSHLGGLLTSGASDAMQIGYHLFASFADVDGDGNLDLLLSDAPSRGDTQPGSFIPSLTLSTNQEAMRLVSTTAADVFQTGSPIPVVAQGWLWLPEGSLSASEPGTDVFLNRPVYDGTQIVSWSERPAVPRQHSP